MCTARTRCAQWHAQRPARMDVARTACACRAHSVRIVCLVARIAPRSWAQVATSSPLPNPKPGRDIISRSRPPGRPSQVATLIPCRDLLSAHSGPFWSRRQMPHGDRTMSRHQKGVATPIRLIQVATPNAQCPLVTPKPQVAKPEACRNPAKLRSQSYVATSSPV